MTYTASNGVEIHQTDTSIGSRVSALDRDPAHAPGFPKAESIHTWLDPRQAEALREFFQHERDEELGRWRWPENPDYVVYPTEDGFIVTHERGGLSEFRNGLWVHDMEGEAARDYREAHPESKPWHDAKAGEVWVLSVDGSDDIPCTVTPSGPDFEPISHPVWATFSRGSDRITDARKIWPEPS